MSYKNKITYSQNDVDAWVNQHIENDATNLAYQHCPVEIGELSAAVRAMDRAFKKILETFPDACLFSADSGLTQD